nr:calcium/proton exchanger [Tanacetum cinerariifolium]
MENVNPPPTLYPPVLLTVQLAKVVQKLDELQEVSSYIYSRLENIKHFLNGFVNLPNEIYMDDLDPDDESVDTPLVSPFLDSDDDSDDGEVLNELEEYSIVGKLYHKNIINNIDGDDLAFPCMIGFRKFDSYFDPFLLMNIIMCKACNTIMVEGLKSTRRNLVAIVKDVYVFVGSFTYVTDFVILEDIWAKSFRNITQIEYDCVKALVSFTRILDNYMFQIPRTIHRKLVQGPVASLYYCKVGTPLRIDIKPLKNDSDVGLFVNFVYQNKWEVNLYVEHSGYDALDIRDQGETMANDGNESSDAYCSSDEEDLNYVYFHTEVDDNVVIKTVTTNDPFLNKLCTDSP